MKIRGIHGLFIVGGAIAVMGVLFFLGQTNGEGQVADAPDNPPHEKAARQKGRSAKRSPDRVAEKSQRAAPSAANVVDSGSGTEGETESLTEDELRAREEDQKVDAFDSLTDKWMESAKDGVTMKDIDTFVAQFRQVPKARKEECLHRALNLIPDENVMLLAGILMDKSQDKDLIELVYNDVLNRDEDVKKPILKQIFKDREHPCWADTAWILDVTGELPTKK